MKTSAGLLVYRIKTNQPEVLIVHPGGPFWSKKDRGAWSIPKGEYDETEDPLNTAKREFEEETSFPPPNGEYIDLGEIKRKDGKYIKAWAVEGDLDETKIKSNEFEMEWPPKSGLLQKFPEIDRGAWFSLDEAAEKVQPAQIPFLERLAKKLNTTFEVPTEFEQGSLF